jgi:dolichyl-phosphate-mannose-protein mannosyltransferase
LNRTFYFDVHPPLGKILVGVAGLLAGYTGDFEFKSGEKYPEGLNYGLFRSYLALFGAFIPPLVYLIGCNLRFSKPVCVMIGIMALSETGLFFLYIII